jgi:trimethylamine--corrinoid protein Co-methyltransferase
LKGEWKLGRANLKLLSTNEIHTIHDATLQILKDIGLLIRSNKVLKILDDAGAQVNHEKSIAKIPEAIVKEALKKAPKTVKLSARDPKHNITIPSKTNCYLTTDGLGVYMLDLETGERRLGTRKDLANFAILADALESVQVFWPTIVVSDVPKPVHELHEFVTSLKNTAKHIEHEAMNAKEAQYEIEMASAIVGSREELKKKPIISVVQCPISPLTYEKGSIEATAEFAKANIPVVAMAMPNLGATGPVTIAGSIAVGNAENLGSLIVTQLVNPGAPFIYSITSMSTDMKTGIGASGAPEATIATVSAIQLAKHYGLPCEMGGFGTDAKVPGVQAAFEKALDISPPVMAGVDLIAGIGGLEGSNTLCLEQMIIDSEIWQSALRFARGFDVNNETLALDTIRNVGPGGHFLSQKHTLEHFENELWMPKISDRKPYAAWESGGEKKLVDVAKQRVKSILKNHKPEPIDKAIQEEIDQILKKYEKELLGQ